MIQEGFVRVTTVDVGCYIQTFAYGGFMKIPRSCAAIFFVAVMSALLQGATGSAPHISITLNASDAPRKIFHAQLTMPATPGTLTLYYPKWIPGEHAPSG